MLDALCDTQFCSLFLSERIKLHVGIKLNQRRRCNRYGIIEQQRATRELQRFYCCCVDASVEFHLNGFIASRRNGDGVSNLWGDIWAMDVAATLDRSCDLARNCRWKVPSLVLMTNLAYLCGHFALQNCLFACWMRTSKMENINSTYPPVRRSVSNFIFRQRIVDID